MKIYTKTGDTGMTSLVGGRRVSKTDPRLDAYGTVDELNSHLGFLISFLPSSTPSSTPPSSSSVTPRPDNTICSECSNPSDIGLLRSSLLRIQSRLFDLGAYLATHAEPSMPPSSPRGITDAEINWIESEIDRMTAVLPQLTSFILPGGTMAASQAHICRTVCRRAERHALAIDPLPHPLALAYLNRLSDYLFTLARYLNHITSTPEIPWHP